MSGIFQKFTVGLWAARWAESNTAGPEHKLKTASNLQAEATSRVDFLKNNAANRSIKAFRFSYFLLNKKLWSYGSFYSFTQWK